MRHARLAALVLLLVSPPAHGDDSPPGNPPDQAPEEPSPPEPEPAPATQPAPQPQPAPELEPDPDPSPPPTPVPTAPPVPTPSQAAAAVMPASRTRPHFIKGELSTVGAVHALTQRNFVGASAGISAVPSSADTVLNAFFLTVEPQVDIRSRKRDGFKLGLGVPLQFQLIDTRGALERCLSAARDAKDAGKDPGEAASACVDTEKERAQSDLGKLRSRDWDEPSDYAKVIRYLTIGAEEQPFYLNVSRLFSHSLGHGTVVRRYNPNLDYNTTRVGATLDAYYRFVGFESMLNDIVDPDVLGLLAFVRPLEPFFSDVVPLRSLSVGVSASVGRNVPLAVSYEKGVLDPGLDEPIPMVDAELNPTIGAATDVTVVGLDVETKLLRTESSDLKVYFDAQQMVDHGRGYTLGSLWRFSLGKPSTQAIRLRAEAHLFDPDYLPAFFDGFYDIHKIQFMPAGYYSAGLLYYPTKLAYLTANAGGKRRAGGYLELTHSFLNRMTIGLAARGSFEIGSPREPGFTGPSFDDYTKCTWKEDQVDCSATPKQVLEPMDDASLLLHVEFPFRKYLQALATYEIFAMSRKDGFDLFEFDGDNEVFFSALRLQLLPILFMQAEARRFYFLQRLTNVDIDRLKIEQDQNFHSEWTFALNLYAGYEF
ncbi:MAG: hypothetical protein HY698_18315 [Deltaproteobacteria bacterium]|nr:hypothetical protein [Deltaproteobacteria bacterium]